jgi:hypothetical protein
MPVAWHALSVPGPPVGFELDASEAGPGTPSRRFRRRLIAMLDCAAGAGDRLALVDKAIPHAQFDLMLSEASDRDKPGADDVAPQTGRALWRTGLDFVRHVSRPEIMERYGLGGGTLHLALNCDPNTRDRESVQAAKQFHLHLLYWTADELSPLADPGRLERPMQYGPRERRQLLDPLGFVGASALTELLSDMHLGIAGAQLMPMDDGAVIAGTRPMGAVIRLPGWGVLADPAFEDLIRRLHRRIQSAATTLLSACTGESEPPPDWRRHPLLPVPERLAALAGSDLPRLAGLGALLGVLRDLPGPVVERCRRGNAAMRRHLMTLNPPSYSLNLHAPVLNTPEARLSEATPVYLAIQPKLFSGIGGAGLLWLRGVPSVRIRRGVGRFSVAEWRRRAAFQRGFALEAAASLQSALGVPGERAPSGVRRFMDCTRGWA